MRKSGCADTQGWVINTQLWVDEWRRLYPIKPAQCVADSLNAPVRTVEKWFTGEARPSLDWIGPIFCVYGFGFFVTGIPDPTPWMDDFAREERRTRLIAKRTAIDEQLEADWQRRAGS